MINKALILFFSLCLVSFGIHADEKVYIDNDDLNTTAQDTFRIHIGHNVWIEANAVYRDKTGLFTFESNISRSAMCGKGVYAGYEKTWKCPYCYHYWPIGKPCQNPDCPSKYK